MSAKNPPPVSDRAIMARVNRALERSGSGQRLCRSHRSLRSKLGTYYLADKIGNVLRARLRLGAFAEEVGAARAYQERREVAAKRTKQQAARRENWNECPAWDDGRHFYSFQATGSPIQDAKACVCGRTVSRSASVTAEAVSAKRWSRWTAEEDRYLSESYNRKPFSEIVAHLGRPAYAVRYRACRRGLTIGKNNHRDWESLLESAKRHGLTPRAMRLRLGRAGIAHGPLNGSYVRIAKKDADRVVARFVPRKPGPRGNPLPPTAGCFACLRKPHIRGVCRSCYERHRNIGP